MSAQIASAHVTAPGKRLIRTVLISIPLIALVVWTVLPILMTLSVSFKTRADVFANPELIPRNPTLDGYQRHPLVS